MSSHLDHIEYITETLLQLLAIPSPTGYTEKAISFVEQQLTEMGIKSERSPKGALTWEIAGTGKGHVTVSGHVDTLGAMVKSIKSNGRLSLFNVGGYDWGTVEGAEVQIHTQEGKVYSGTVVNNCQSVHVHGPALRDLKRNRDNMEVRLDEVVSNATSVASLGIAVGDFVSYDSQPRLTSSGYIKGRHLDNKASVAVFLGLSKALLSQPPLKTIAFHITNYEEVGHGAATGIPSHTEALIAVDMAAVGNGQTSSEHHVSLCVADSSGPYDHQLSNKLRANAKEAGIDLRVDIYPYYGSDGSAAWAAGGNYPVALVGPGVDASHAFERTHKEALQATYQLLKAHVSVE